MALDKSKPYGTVCGTSDAAYEQDGVLYDINEEPIGGEESPKRTRKTAANYETKRDVVPDTTTPPEIEAQIAANLEG